MIDTVKIIEKFELVDKYWTPKIIGELNGQYVKIAKIKGAFIWHHHQQEDELFMVMKGNLIIEFRDHIKKVAEGEMIIVPKGVEHLPRTENDEEVWIMLFEPASTLNTGNLKEAKTVEKLERI